MKLIAKLILALLLLTFVYTVYASVVRIYVFNRGINTNDNTFDLQSNVAKTAINVYTKSGKLYQRYGSKSWKSYGTSDQGYRKTVYYSPNIQLVGNVTSYLINLDNAGNGYLVDNTSTPVYSDVQSPYPISINSGVGYPSAFDCEIFRGVEYCSGFEERLGLFENKFRVVTNFKLDARMTSNVIETMDSATGWTAVSADTANIAASAFGSVEGTGYISWDKTGTASTPAGIKKTVKLNLSEYADYYLTLWTNSVVSGTSSGIYVIQLTTAGVATDYLQYQLSTGAVSNKWNLIDINSPDATLGSTNLANITEIRIFMTSLSSAHTYVGAAVDALCFYPKFQPIGVEENTNTLVGAVGAAGALTGSYSYKFTCKTWEGTEGNVGPVSNTVVATADKIDLTSIDVCNTDLGNIKSRVIYRNRNGTTTYWKVTEITNNVDTTYTDNTADTSLVDLAPTTGDELNDNSAPDPGKYIEVYNNRLFIGPTQDNDSLLQISDISDNNTVIEPESFPTNNTEIINANDNDGITGMKTRLDSMIVGKGTSMYSMQGTKPGEYFVEKILHNKGTVWNNEMIVVDGVFFFLGDDSIYAINSDNNVLDVGYPIKNQLNLQDAFSASSVPLGTAEYYPVDNQIWFTIPSTSNGWNSGYSGSTYIAILNLDNGLENPTWTKYDFTHYSNSQCESGQFYDLEYATDGTISKNMLINLGGMEIIKYPQDPLRSGSSSTGDENGCTFTAIWETRPLFECGQEVSPSTPKKYDWVKLIATGNDGIDLTLSWGFGDWNNDYDSYNYSQTVPLNWENNNTAHYLVYPKIPLTGGTGNDRNLSFKISHTSGVGGAGTETGDQFVLYGYEYKCTDLGGEF